MPGRHLAAHSRSSGTWARARRGGVRRREGDSASRWARGGRHPAEGTPELSSTPARSSSTTGSYGKAASSSATAIGRDRQGRQPGHHGRRASGHRYRPSTDVMAVHGLILTAGGIDCHVQHDLAHAAPLALGARDHHADRRRRHRAGGGGPRRPLSTPGAWHRPGCCEVHRAWPFHIVAARHVTRLFVRSRCGSSCGPARAGFKLQRGLGHDAGRDPTPPLPCHTGGGGDGLAIHPDTLTRQGSSRTTLRRGRIAGQPIQTLPHEGAGGGHALGHHHRGPPCLRSAVVDQPDRAAAT